MTTKKKNPRKKNHYKKTVRIHTHIHTHAHTKEEIVQKKKNKNKTRRTRSNNEIGEKIVRVRDGNMEESLVKNGFQFAVVVYFRGITAG